MNPSPVAEVAPATKVDWNLVHAEVQSIWDRLASRVMSRCPAVTVSTGRTSGRAFFLYTYQRFAWPKEAEGEAVCVGINFTPSPTGDAIHLCADIGGEETGMTDMALPERDVPNDPASVLAAARELAQELSRKDEIIAQALSEHRLAPDYRNGQV
jgi:hypothetical protein